MPIVTYAKATLARLQERHNDIPHVDIVGPITCNCRACDASISTVYSLGVKLQSGSYFATASINGIPEESAKAPDLGEALNSLAVKLATKETP